MGKWWPVETCEQEHFQINSCSLKKVTLAAVPQEEQLGGEEQAEMMGLKQGCGSGVGRELGEDTYHMESIGKIWILGKRRERETGKGDVNLFRFLAWLTGGEPQKSTGSAWSFDTFQVLVDSVVPEGSVANGLVISNDPHC